ncbi:YlxR family protein [Okeania sp.]|uniref:YlxR family protein n=1 Tax=Okeania sp. TaxID=3100323 RepID=UPI002B4B14C5|nr:YlxR family protein [Okeania sp.]MEB3340074.1 YlxR family protein [Okeania sp.]
MKQNYRRCVSCKKLAPKEEFWRVVRSQKSDTIELDHGEGRSAYICPQEECLKIADQKNKLGRSLKAYVSKGIYDSLWQRLKNSSPTVT